MTSTKTNPRSVVPMLSRSLAVFFGMVVLGLCATAKANVLEEIGYATSPDGSVRIVLHLSEPAAGAQAFTTADPPRIAVDLPDTTNRVKDRRIAIGNGATSAVSAIEAAGRTRVVIDLFQTASYDAYADGSTYVIQVAGAQATAGTNPGVPGLAHDPAKRINGRNASVTNIDFRRTPEGAGRIVLNFDSEDAVADLRTEGQKVIVELPGVDLPDSLRQKLDVVDFATPVQTIESLPGNGGSRITATIGGLYKTAAYQTMTEYVLEVAPVGSSATGASNAAAVAGSAPGQQEAVKGYTGTPVTFNFQDIPVRQVLQLIAQESNLNIVAADSVGGNLTLRLDQVPWDQALDIVLRAKGLDKRQDGNVIWIAPQTEIASYEKALADARIANEERAELITEYVQINYGRASEIASLLTEDSKSSSGGGGGESQKRGFLSPRGSVSFDARTNTLLLNDSAEKIAEIKKLILLLDRPVDQVLIEARIVIANEDFARELGARFGVSGARQDGSTTYTTSGSLDGSSALRNRAGSNRMNGQGSLAGIGGALLSGALSQQLNVNLPVANPAGAVGFSILGADYLLDLELSALQSEGRGEVVSSPRVITSNQQPATINQGQEVGYVTTSGVGANATPTVNFKEALLELKVTPTITKDGRVFMNINVKKDEIAGYVNLGQLGSTPELTKRLIETAVLVDSGQTVVIGGVYEFSSREDLTKVPFLGDVPVLGNLFRSKTRAKSKAELLIFVTPRVLAITGDSSRQG
jgi:type IV pilus assembly protein PilQ